MVHQPIFLAGPDLQQGTLVKLFPQYRAAELGIHAVYGSRKHLAPKVRLLVDFLAREFEQKQWLS
jgi:DNA-binding transcriptional LysR family regulator